MTTEEFLILYQSGNIELNPFYGGTYNEIFITKNQYLVGNANSHWIFKKPRKDLNIPDGLKSASFACEIWQKINPEHLAFVCESENLWISPYFGYKRPNEEQVYKAILNIYQRTGIIIADGFNADNFVLLNNQAICIDIKYAILSNCPQSDMIFNQMIATQDFDRLIVQQSYRFFQTKRLIKTLFYLEQQLRHQPFDRAMVTSWMIDKLHLFRLSSKHIYILILEILLHFQQNLIDEKLIYPELLLLFMFHWDAQMNKKQIEGVLKEIEGYFKNFPVPENSQQIRLSIGFFEHLEKRKPYSGKFADLSF